MRLIALFLLGMMGIANAQTQTQTFTSYVNSLNSASTINNSDQLWISQGGVGKRLPGSVLLAAVTGVASVSGTSGQVVCSPITGAVICGLASPLNVIGGTLAAGTSALNVTATQPATPIGGQNAVAITITGAGSASQINDAVLVSYAPGYTGSSNTNAINAQNNSSGTGGSLSSLAMFGNRGLLASAGGAGSGWNSGVLGSAANGVVNIGVSGFAGTAINSGKNIGGLFSASNSGSSPVFIGEYITLGGTTIPATSAGLIVDNVATAVPIALFQANGTSQVEIQASGGVTMPSTVTGGDEGAGTINVSGGYYVNGSPITTLAHGGTNAALTASNGGIVYSTGSALAILSGTATPSQCLLSGASAAPTWGSCLGGAAVSSVTDDGGNTLTISPNTGAVLAGLNLAHANTWSAALTDSVSLTSPIVYGGSAAGSTLALTSTSSGSPTTDSITMTTGGVVRATVLSGGNVGFGTETNPQSSFVFSTNTTTGITAVASAGLNIIGANSSSATLQLTSFAGANFINVVRANGTAASPTALASGQGIGAFAAGGYDGSAFTAGNAAARLDILSNPSGANWTTGDHGTLFEFETTPAGSTTRAQQMRVDAGVIIGTGTSAPGAGNLAIGGNVTSGGWQGTVVGATYGGTGVNNGSNTLTVSSHSGTLAFGNASKTLTINNSIALTGTDSTVMTFPGTSSTVLTTGNSATTTVGYLFTSYSAGTVSSGTFTPAAANANYQYLTNNGAFTLAVPAADSAMDILVTNGASAGAITFSGYTVGSNTGDAYVTTNTDQFILSIRRINGVSTYVWKALQ